MLKSELTSNQLIVSKDYSDKIPIGMTSYFYTQATSII